MMPPKETNILVMNLSFCMAFLLLSYMAEYAQLDERQELETFSMVSFEMEDAFGLSHTNSSETVKEV